MKVAMPKQQSKSAGSPPASQKQDDSLIVMVSSTVYGKEGQAMIPASINEQLRGGESETVAFIADPRDFDGIARTVCAFLNSKGGSVFCGVDKRGRFVTLPSPKRIVNSLRQHLQEKISPQAPLLSVTLDDEDKHHLVSIEVPAGADKPYVYEGAAYIRQESQTRPADAATLRRMLQDAAVLMEPWERRVSTALDFEDLDLEEVTQTMKEADKSGRFTFAEPDDASAALKQLGMVRFGRFTQGADVLFARNPALRHPQIRVRATCFSEDKGSSRFIDDKVFEGPLVAVLKQAEQFLRRNMRTSVSFQDTGLQTQDVSEYPPEAIREGLVNALAHRDYSAFHGGVAILLYPSRLEIWNSGRLPDLLKPGDLKKNHPSIPVNPDIVQVLYIRGYMNRIGRGTQQIVSLCEGQGLRTPTWKDEPTGVTLTLYASVKEVAPSIVFSERQNALLDALKAGEEFRRRDYLERFAGGVTERQARRDLKELEDAHLVERIGASSATRYRRTNQSWAR